MNSMCRLCAEILPIENMICTIKDQTLNIRQKLIDCCRWDELHEDQNDHYPRSICKSCYEKLEQCWNFTQSVAQAQFKIYEYFEIERKEDIISGLSNIDDIKAEDDPSIYFGESSQAIEIIEQKLPVTENNIECESNDSESGDSMFCDRLYESSDDENDKNSLSENKAKENAAQTQSTVNPVVKMSERQFMELTKNDCNDDGSVKEDKVKELQLVNWTILEYRCWICSLCSPDRKELKSHMQTQHSDEIMKSVCTFCTNVNFISRNSLHRHMIRVHFPYLKNW